jgi:uncharacterized membrane protein (DUF485 family)
VGSHCRLRPVSGTAGEQESIALPTRLFFLAYYFLCLILLEYAPRLMSTRVVGAVTLAHLFALSQFVVGWTIAALHLRACARFDQLVKNLLATSRQEICF